MESEAVNTSAPAGTYNNTTAYSVRSLSEAGSSFFFQPRVILRMLEWFFALIAFATIASLHVTGWSRGDFAIFVGVVSWVISMLLLFNYALGLFINKGMLYFEFGFSVLWIIFWFAAATALAATKCVSFGSFSCSTFHASIAFSYFAFACYICSTILVWLDLKAQ